MKYHYQALKHLHFFRDYDATCTFWCSVAQCYDNSKHSLRFFLTVINLELLPFSSFDSKLVTLRCSLSKCLLYSTRYVHYIY